MDMRPKNLLFRLSLVFKALQPLLDLRAFRPIMKKQWVKVRPSGTLCPFRDAGERSD